MAIVDLTSHLIAQCIIYFKYAELKIIISNANNHETGAEFIIIMSSRWLFITFFLMDCFIKLRAIDFLVL